MKKLLLITVLILLACGVVLAQQYSRIQIDLSSHSIVDLAQLGLDVEHGTYAKGRFFVGDFSANEIALLQNNGFAVTVLIADVKAYYVLQNQNPSANKASGDCTGNTLDFLTPQNFSLGSMGGFLTYQEMLDNLDSMAAKYPNIISARAGIDSTNPSHDGRLIYWLRISDNPNVDENEPEALYTALHHAREPASMQQVIFYMWYLLENYATDAEIQYLVDNTEMYFIPCVNPDGYVYNQQTDPNGGGLWRKNRRNNGGGSRGVDLNRNYGYEWGFDNVGSSPDDQSDTYRGPSAFSEPELQNVRDFVDAHQIRITLNYHTYGNLLIHPWGYSDANTKDSTSFRAFAKYMTRYNHYVTGTGTETVGYVTNGDSDDWMYGDTTNRPAIFSLTPEAGEDNFGFWPPSNAIEEISKQNMHQNLAVPRLLLNFGEVVDKTSLFFSDTSANVYYNVQRLGLTAGTLTVSVQPVSANIAAVGSGQSFILNQFEMASDSISINFLPNITDGEAVVYVLSLSNGINTYTDTITKTYGAQQPLHADAADSLNNWSNSGNSNWAVTTNDYYTAPACITDSPNGDYQDNKTARIDLVTPIDLTDTMLLDATLSFWTIWDIESGFDYAQVLVSTDGNSFTPLCGNYTKPGTSNQDENEPIFDGTQSDWVQEQMDLSGYIGQQVYIRFILKSDAFVTGDGFYFDDLTVDVIYADSSAVLDTTPIGISVVELNDFTAYPNPTAETVHFSFGGNLPNNAVLTISNTLGEQVFTESISGNLSVDVANWPVGVYFYRLLTANGLTESKKLLILR